MKPWHELVKPHQDIQKGRFDESVFAADLSDVKADRGPLEYRDAETFFRKTYPTAGLVKLLSAVVSRLSGKGKGEAVIQIQTPFGGGKTHSLIALYHIMGQGQRLKAVEAVASVLKDAGVQAAPKASVAAFVGTAADPLKGKTPWGELAEQLDAYAVLRDHDQKRRAPGKDLLHKLLSKQPTLILMDEIAAYAVAAKDIHDQLMVFFQQLTEAVKVLPQCALVVTLPSSAPYGEQGERALSELQRIFGRVEAIYRPVEGQEIYEVIRRRLFEDMPDAAEVRKVADTYWEMYQRLGDDVPREVRQAAYRDKLRKAYPFHPELIDILFERWSTFPTFQRTRGVLRLLAEVTGDLYRRHFPSPLIQPAHINLTNPTIRGEFLKHIGNEYEGVIAADIADGNAKAARIDQEMGSEYARFGIAGGLATAVFFGSFSGGERRGMGIQRLRVAVLREDIPPALVGDAMRRLEDVDGLWYLHEENGVYSFSNQPNLNRVIVEKEEAIRPQDVMEEIHGRLEDVAGEELAVTLWPRASADVPDTKRLKLGVLSPEQDRQDSSACEFVAELLGKCGLTFRTYRNAMLVAVADAGGCSTLRQQAKRLLALRAIHGDKTVMRQLTEDSKKALAGKIKDIDGSLTFHILSTYRHLAKAGESQVDWFDLGLPTVGEKASLANRVLEYLKGEDLLLDKIAPRQVLEKALGPEEQQKALGEVMEAFLRYPQLPMLVGDGVLHSSVGSGVSTGVFGLRAGDQVYYKETVPAAALDETAVLLGKEVAEAAKQAKPGEALAPGEKPGLKVETGNEVEGAGKVVGVAEKEKAKPTGIRALTLRAKIPWDKLSDFVRGVITPLRNDGAELEVEVTVKARSECGGIKKSTLEQKVKETLDQIGAEVLGESEE